MNIRSSTRRLVMLSIFVAIELALGFPGSPLHAVGFPALGPIRATTMHIPVILGAVLMGPLYGGILGGIMGLCSFLTAVMTPNLTSPFFLRPEISILPRILIGVVAGWIYRALSGKGKLTLAAVLAALGGTLTNTVLVVGMMTLRGAVGAVESSLWEAFQSIVSVIVSISGACELVLAVILVSALEKALRPMARAWRRNVNAGGNSGKTVEETKKTSDEPKAQ